MALRGQMSKSRKLGNTPNADWTDVTDVPYDGVSPDLPKLSNRRKWSELVLQWWEMVRSMPHCVLWDPTDWQFALETALMKDAFWREYDAGEMKSTMATEIRRREDQLGTTVEARRKLRIRYVKPAGEEPEDPDELPVLVVEQQEAAGAGVASVTALTDRRARLTRAATASA